MVTKEQVANAKADWSAAKAAAYAANAWDATHDADAADAAHDAAHAAWDKYIKLKREFDNESN